MTSFETLYRKKYCTLIYWEEVDDRNLIGYELVQITIDKVKIIKKKIKTAQHE